MKEKEYIKFLSEEFIRQRKLKEVSNFQVRTYDPLSLKQIEDANSYLVHRLLILDNLKSSEAGPWKWNTTGTNKISVGEMLNYLDPELSNRLWKNYLARDIEPSLRKLPQVSDSQKTNGKITDPKTFDVLLGLVNDKARKELIQIVKGFDHQDFLKHISANLALETLKILALPRARESFYQLLENAIVKRKRVLITNSYAVKFPEANNNDSDFENLHEALVGIQVNKVRAICPNFVWSYGIARVKAPAMLEKHSKKKEYLCYLSEKIKGTSFSHYRYDNYQDTNKSFRELFPILAQVWLALFVANQKVGLTHHDLHSGNVIIIELEKPVILEYITESGIIKIKTKTLAKIIDWGRSFAFGDNKLLIGRSIPSQNVRPNPNYFYDCYFILERSFDKYREPEVIKFLNFFDVRPSGSIYRDMAKVANTNYSLKTWFELILGCESGKEHLTFEQFKVEKPRVLAPDYTFIELRDYLTSDNNERVFTHQIRNLVEKQKMIEERRLTRLINLRDVLTETKPLPVELMFKNPDEKVESSIDEFLDYREKIMRITKSKFLKSDLESHVEIFRRRLDFLSRWLSV